VRKRLLVTCLILTTVLLCGLSRAADVGQQYNQANKLFAKGKFTEALPLYQSLLSAKPAPEVSSGVLYTRIADIYFRMGDYKNARDAYRSALKGQTQSERPPTQYWIGFCAFLMGKDAEAADEFLKIPQLYPDSGMWVSTGYYWAGRMCERMGKKELAAGYFRKAGGSGRSTQGRFALEKAEKIKEDPNAQITISK
jgi:tetratricopeptide (TPR) repeat protein